MNLQKTSTCRRISYENQHPKNNGFTIVELLIVIVVIAILAVIATVSYNGIINRARESALQSDLNNASKAINLIHAETGRYPATSSEINNGQGLKTSEGNTLTYNVNADGTAICVQIQGYAKSYFVTENNSAPAAGTCSNYTGVPQSSEAPAPAVNGGVVTTLAGSSAGYQNGTGTGAQFRIPYGIAVDSAGNVYVADTYNHRIRKTTPSGVVTTLAGSGAPGHADGTGTAAIFNYPYGIVVDSSGNIYVADNSNHRIRKIDTNGVVTTLAGSGTAGFADGTGTAAMFYGPRGITVDTAGNIYVADSTNNRIRKIDTNGVVTTLAGSGTAGFADGTGTAARFNNPTGITIDSSGTVFVADRDNHRIRKVTSSAVVTTIAGSGSTGFADGTGTAARLWYPFGLVVNSSGDIFVADTNNHRIRKITSGNEVSTLAGSGTSGGVNGTGIAAQFYFPGGVTTNATGVLYVIDTSNHRIRKIE